jgi:hypothetical protein
MKLKNRKTGKITEIEEVNLVVMDDERDCYESFAEYHSLAELNADWEDYTPKEPLIKDEKIRNAVRAWAEANEIETVEYDEYWVSFRRDDKTISFKDEDRRLGFYELENSKDYTIDELCGDEE